MCVWIKDNLGDQVPVHFSRLYAGFSIDESSPTPLEKLEEAQKIAKEAGLKYVIS